MPLSPSILKQYLQYVLNGNGTITKAQFVDDWGAMGQSAFGDLYPSYIDDDGDGNLYLTTNGYTALGIPIPEAAP